MIQRKFSPLVPALAAALLLLTAAGAPAQSPSGNLFGTVVDDAGSPLADVAVTLKGPGAPRTRATGTQGNFRFSGLAPATYSLTATRAGFSTVEHTRISIHVNRNTTIEITMRPAVEETITVTTESPLLDRRRIAPGSTLTRTELERIPSARDPWAVLPTVPGVQTDRINVGGNESGQQAQFTGVGSTGDDAAWVLDGVTMTDMAAAGSSPTYFNYDSFEELRVTTGGNDATLATGGVTLNLVTRRGTREWRGSARYLRADDDWQSDLDVDPSDLGPGQGSFAQGNRIVSVEEWGAEIGGPLVEDKLWIWANYGRNDIGLLTIADFDDPTEIESYGTKLNAEPTASSSLVAFYNFGDKTKVGRNAGPTRAQPTTWNQSGPTDVDKLEGTYVFSSSFYLTGMAAYVGGGFELTPQGGLGGLPITFDENFIWQNNFFHHDTDRPQVQAKLDGNYFFNTGNVSHDLKFGVGYRKAQLESQSLFPGNGVRFDFYQALGATYQRFQLSRPYVNDSDSVYQSLYAQDTLTVGNLTANIGLRYDKQDGTVYSFEIPGVAGFETFDDGSPLLPAATTNELDPSFEWSDVTPRLGLTYALGAERKTLLRASYSRFAEQLRQGYTLQEFTGFAAYAYFYYEDRNGDGFVSRDELIDLNGNGILDPGDLLDTNEYDPASLTTVDRTDPGFEAPVTDEIILGVEHALLPELVIGVTVTLRRQSKIAEFERLVIDPASTTGCIEVTAEGCLRPHVASDYVLDSRSPFTDDGGAPGFDPGNVSVPFYSFRGGLIDTGGTYMTNGDREQDYQGLSLYVNKRLSNRWMVRGHLTYQDWEWDVPESEREDPNLYLGGAEDDGGPVLQGSATGSGSKGGVYINAGWSYGVTGLFQIAPDKKWGFNVGAAVYGHEGYPIPYYIGRISGFQAGSVNLQATADSDDFSNPDVHLLDLRLEKDVRFGDGFSLTVGVDLFNVFNEATVLQRQHRLNTGTANYLLEVVSPRVWRAGVRLRFH